MNKSLHGTGKLLLNLRTVSKVNFTSCFQMSVIDQGPCQNQKWPLSIPGSVDNFIYRTIYFSPKHEFFPLWFHAHLNSDSSPCLYQLPLCLK